MRLVLTKPIIALTLLCCVMMSACTWSDPVSVEDDFGNSVRHLVQQQKLNPEASQNSADVKPAGMDGGSVLNAMDQYRSAQKRKVIKEKLDPVK